MEILKSMNKIYLAGPISGLQYNEAVSWRDKITEILKDTGNKICCLSPMRTKGKLNDRCVGRIQQSYEDFGCMYSDRGIMSRDFHDCTTSDLVIFNLLDAKTISIGTIMELAWCYQSKIPSVVIMLPERFVNIHDHPMVREAINFRVNSIEEAVEVAISILGL
jgi:nucleoside 2-deoxyribosyltransferase